jgi:hypothetical protein
MQHSNQNYFQTQTGTNQMNLEKLLAVLMFSVMVALPVTVTAETAITAPAATAEPMFGDYQAVGFLSDYANIPTTKDADGAYAYRDKTVDFSKYNKLLVDRIKIYFKDDSDYKGIDPDELQVLTNYFYEAINKAVGDAYPLVTEPGPDVLRLRIAATDLVPNKPAASVTTLVVPFLWIGDAGSGVVTGDAGSTVFTGHVTLEVEALDSDSSKQLAARIETESGKKYNWTHGIKEGVTGYLDAYSKWDYTKKAMDDWARLLRQRLDELHGKTDTEKTGS